MSKKPNLPTKIGGNLLIRVPAIRFIVTPDGNNHPRWVQNWNYPIISGYDISSSASTNKSRARS